MKTHDEIKKGMNHCSCSEPCVECLYDGRDFPLCIIRMLKDAIAYIQQLEAERDAAIEELAGVLGKVENAADFIDEEIYYDLDYGTYRKLRDVVNDIAIWENEDKWRGVCDENSGKDAEQHG